jgi:hypothetical protein
MRVLTFFLSLVSLLGCARGERPSPITTTDPTSPAADFHAGPDDAVSIVGLVVDSDGVPVSGQPFAVRDRNGMRDEGVTGPDGSLASEGAFPPYDLLVEDTAFLGVSRGDPFVVLDHPTVHTHHVRPITVTVTGACAGCVVDVVGVTASGTAFASGSSLIKVSPPALEDETVAVHVLVHDPIFTTFSYSKVDTTAAAVAVAPTPVDTTDAMTLDTGAEVALDVPGGGWFRIGSRIPKIAGASWRVKVRSTHAPAPPLLYGTSAAWSGALSIGASAPSLYLDDPPIVSANASGVSWAVTPGMLATADVFDVAHGAYRYRVVTNDASISFDRLKRLGLATLLSGAHTVTLATAEATAIDDALSADPTIRGRPTNEHRPGGSTYERVGFNTE